jgi:hypothetical protein
MRTPRALRWGGLLALLGAGAFLLPVTPIRAQQPPAAAEPIRVRLLAEDDVVKARVKEASVEQITAELEKKRAELAKLEAALKAAQAGKQPAGAGAEKSGVNDIIMWKITDGKLVPVKPGEQPNVVFERKTGQILEDPRAKPAETKDAKAQLEEARKRLDALLVEVQNRQRPVVIEVMVDGKKKQIELPPGSRVINAVEPPKVPAPPVKPPAVVIEPKNAYVPVPVPPGTPMDASRIVVGIEARPVDTDRRVAEIEKKLAEIVRELESLRKDLKDKTASPQWRVVPAQPGIPQRIDPNDSPRK